VSTEAEWIRYAIQLLASLEALKKSGSIASETLSIGDSLHDDIIPAKKAGLKTVWVNRNGRRANANKDYVDFEVSDLTEASRLLSFHNVNGR